jgi:hypothetical protein
VKRQPPTPSSTLPDRRRFLGQVAGVAAIAAGGLALSPAELAASELPAPVTDKWDVAWADRLTGRARGVFDSPAIEEGGALFRAIMWMNQNKEVYGLKDEEMNAVLVIRHAAIPMVATDEFWERYKIGKKRKVTDWSVNKPAQRNPFIEHPSPDGKPSPGGAYSLGAFMKRGGIVLACNLAFGQIVYDVGKEEKLQGPAARARALTYLLPGVILQPSGVFGAMRAQASGCAYIMAT